MPNWCYNYLDISGDETLIADIKRQLNKPFVKTHDSWNATTGNMELSQTQYSNPVFAFHNIYNHIQDGVSDEEYIKQPDFNQPLEESLMFRGNSWYDWNVRNWGTKWDVAVNDNDKYPDTELYEDTDNSLGYKFNTAWSPPIEAITKLSILYPTVNFNLSYEEETGWGGEVTLLNGFITTVEEYDNKCRDCDSLNTLEYCENDCGEICSACNYMGEADLDCVADCDVHKIYLTEEFVPDYRLEKQ
jgi:hypothetical protein